MSSDNCETCIPFTPRSPLSVLSTPTPQSRPETPVYTPKSLAWVDPVSTPVEEVAQPAAKPTEYDGYKGYSLGNSAAALIVWFIILFVIIAVCLYALKPTMIYKKKKDEIDNGKIILTALVLALLIVLFFWLIAACFSKKE